MVTDIVLKTRVVIYFLRNRKPVPKTERRLPHNRNVIESLQTFHNESFKESLKWYIITL